MMKKGTVKLTFNEKTLRQMLDCHIEFHGILNEFMRMIHDIDDPEIHAKACELMIAKLFDLQCHLEFSEELIDQLEKQQ